MIKRSGMFALLAAFAFSSACASDDAAKKDDAAATAEEAPAEEAPAEENPAPAEAAAENVEVNNEAFEKAARITGAKTDDGKNAVQMAEVTEDGGYGKCGLKNGDIVVSIGGAEVPTGREAVKALREACTTKAKIQVKRGEEEVSLGD